MSAYLFAITISYSAVLLHPNILVCRSVSGQNDIKKLRKENEQLRREIWSLRDEYDKLEDILKKEQKTSGESEEYEVRNFIFNCVML